MPDDQPVILTGWKNIADACGLTVYRMKMRAKKYRMPYVRLCGWVTIPKPVLIEWVRGLCSVVKEEGGRDDYVLGRLRNLKVLEKEAGEKERGGRNGESGKRP